MIKTTLYFGNPTYLSLRLVQLVIKRINSYLPERGKVGVLNVTDKQFGEMQVFYGKKTEQPQPAPVQLELF